TTNKGGGQEGVDVARQETGRRTPRWFLPCRRVEPRSTRQNVICLNQIAPCDVVLTRCGPLPSARDMVRMPTVNVASPTARPGQVRAFAERMVAPGESAWTSAWSRQSTSAARHGSLPPQPLG